ncbi:hypothetical protein BT96DRAFT_987253 [Gymnopus androsaceus JB14]|uniref:Uncharacterized protein n=1 Tax=Gymnopus androsaceus JB14 TaxID=1447944 RepID=A0A6A4I7L4_9AGAR|nr:hypothetical protein BT96DRAFT_987253 [Gymnopus androsaceus JB14]
MPDSDFSDDSMDVSMDVIGMFAASDMKIPQPTEEDIQKTSTRYSQSIFQNWNELHHILKLHEETIRKRWAKKTTKQKETILRSAYPDIPTMHRPDLAALREENLEQRRQGTRFRDAFLLPELNMEDLIKPKNVLLALNSRGRNMPDIFAFTDFEKILIARTSEGVPIPYKNECTMYLTGNKDAKNYGKLVYWSEASHVMADMINGVGMIPGAGLIVLESQHKLYEFLVKVAKAIVHDLPLSGDPPPDPPSLEDPSTGVRAFIYCCRLVRAKVDQAQDHLWSLREDPSYFRDVALEYSEHRLEHLLTKDGSRHPNLHSPWLYDQIFLSLIGNAYTSVLQWQLIEGQLEEVERLRAKFGLKLSREKALPSEYDDHMSHLQYFLQKFMLTGPIKDLKIGAFGAPPMRRWFNRLPQDPNSTIIGYCYSSAYENSPSSERPQIPELIWYLLDDKQSLLIGRHTLLDEIDRLLRSDSRERACVTPWVLNYLSEMSAISELLRQLVFHQPRIGCNTTIPVDLDHFLPDDPEFFDGRSVLYEKMSEPLTRLVAPMRKKDFRGKGMALVDPATSETNSPLGNGKLNYPLHKKATQAVIEQMRKAEAELDAFWGKFDGIIERRTGKKPNDLLKEFIDQREVERTPEWANIPTTPKPNLHAQPKSQIEDRFALMELQQRTESTLGPELGQGSKKRKTKTRGLPTLDAYLPQPLLDGSEQALPDLPNTSSLPREAAIPVPRRAYTVFTRLFFTPSPDRTPGEVPWTDFVHAMTTAGCAVKRLMGSSWMFSRVEGADESDGFGAGQTQIIFHAPHPAANIPIHIEKKRPRPDSGTINQEESPESIHLTWIRRELALKPEEVVPDSDPLSYTSIFNFSLDAEPSRNPRLIAASFESSDYLPSPSLQTSTMNRQNDRNPIHSGKQKARPLTRSSDTRHVRIDEVIPDSDPDSILSIDTLPSPRLIMASFEPNSRFSSDHKMTQSQKHDHPSSVLSPSYMPLPPSSPSSESRHGILRFFPALRVIDFSAFEPCTRPPSPYLHLNTAQGPIATKSSGERAPMASNKAVLPSCYRRA